LFFNNRNNYKLKKFELAIGKILVVTELKKISMIGVRKVPANIILQTINLSEN